MLLILEVLLAHQVTLKYMTPKREDFLMNLSGFLGIAKEALTKQKLEM